MAMDIDYLSKMVPPLHQAITEYNERTAPGNQYAGVTIGDAADGTLLSAQKPDRTGADELFNDVLSPHLGAQFDTSV